MRERIEIEVCIGLRRSQALAMQRAIEQSDQCSSVSEYCRGAIDMRLRSEGHQIGGKQAVHAG